MNTYTLAVRCTNCLYEASIQIPKEVRVYEAVCPNCGCKSLERSGAVYVGNVDVTTRAGG